MANRVLDAVGLDKLNVTSVATEYSPGTILNHRLASPEPMIGHSSSQPVPSSSADSDNALQQASMADSLVSLEAALDTQPDGSLPNNSDFSDLSLLTWDDQNLSPDWPWMRYLGM